MHTIHVIFEFPFFYTLRVCLLMQNFQSFKIFATYNFIDYKLTFNYDMNSGIESFYLIKF